MPNNKLSALPSTPTDPLMDTKAVFGSIVTCYLSFNPLFLMYIMFLLFPFLLRSQVPHILHLRRYY